MRNYFEIGTLAAEEMPFKGSISILAGRHCQPNEPFKQFGRGPLEETLLCK